MAESIWILIVDCWAYSFHSALEACKCIGVHILLPIQFFVVSFSDSERISEMILPQGKDETFLEVLSQTIQSKLIVLQ